MVLKSKNVVDTLRHDVEVVGPAAVAVVFLCFAGVAIAAAVIDLMALRY